MRELEITFGPALAVEVRGLIRSVLHKLVDDDVPHAHVVKLISDGRSGATVFEVSLRRGQEDQGWVIKIGPPDEMAREVRNYGNLVAPRPSAICAPVVKHTDNAVAYQHVAAFAGLRSMPTPTLEEVVRQAHRGDEHALKRVLRVMSTLFIRLGGTFYDRRDPPDTASLRRFNPKLGPDLILCTTSETCPPTTSEVIFETTVGGGLLKRGTTIELEQAQADGVSVTTGFGSTPEGAVESIRFDDRRALLIEAIESTAQVPSADPSSGLRKVLTDIRYGRMRSVGHGDLNPRNVLLVGDEVYVIDFAETAARLPLLWDPAWLEVGLMRDVFADLPYIDLLQLQRVLALACRMRSLAQQPDDVEDACLRLVADNLVVPFKVLFELRCQALMLHDGDEAWENYLALLYFSGYRTLKWKNNNDPEQVRAVHAVLSTCAEWLVDDAPFQHWADTREALARIAPLLDLTKPEAVELAASLTTGDEPIEVIRDLGGRLAVHQFWQQANDRYADLESSHDHYIHLVILRGNSYLDPIITLRRAPEAIVVGEAGSGKSSLINELVYRLSRHVARARRSDRVQPPVRMPIKKSDLPGIGSDVLKLGAVHVLIDDATEEDLFWAKDFRANYPHTPVLLAMREAPQGLEWPVYQLAPIGDQQALDYVARTMTYQLDSSLRTKLTGVITNSKSPIRSPALLRMAIDHVQRLGDIRSIDEVLGQFFGAGYGAEHQARPLFAEAVSLSLLDEAAVAAYARSFTHRETWRFAVRLRETPARIVKPLVRAVWTDDPEYAAELLMAAATTPSGLVDELIIAQEAVLADTTAGGFHHRAAANALGTLGADKQLAKALIAQHAVPEVLEAIRTLWWHGTTAEERPARERVLRYAFDSMLTSGYPDDVVIAALGTITDMQLTGLELVIAELIPDSPAALTAADTLLHLGVVRPARMRKAHHGLTHARLNALETLLPTLSDLREIQEVENEREDRLLTLQLPAEWQARLNSFGVSDSVALWLQQTRTPSPTVPEISPETVEGLALHVQEVFRQDRLRGLRLAWSITRKLHSKRLHWPWVSLLHELRGDSADLSALIEADDEGRDCAVLALSYRDYHRFAAPRPRIELSSGARKILSARRDTDGIEWALAVAAAGMQENLPDLLQLMETDAGDIDAATGLLARDTDAMSAVHRLLRKHDSVIGLAYFGEWVPLLTSTDEPTVVAAGANALKRWTPGPFTPMQLQTAEATAKWLDDALRTQTLTPERRSLFAELKRHAEKKDGKLVAREESTQDGEGSQPTP